MEKTEIEFIMQMDPQAEVPDDDSVPPDVPDAGGGGVRQEVQAVQFSPLTPAAPRGTESQSLGLIMDVQLNATVELGRSRMTVREVLALGPGSVVELDKLAGEPADLLINGKLLARGEVVVVDESFGIRITEIMSPAERLDSFH